LRPRRLALFFKAGGGSGGGRGAYGFGMVLEVALIDVFPGSEDAFAVAYGLGYPVLAGTPGCRSVRMTRGIESPSRFVLLVEWDDVEAHQNNFRGTERFARWRSLIGEFFATPPVVEHFTDVEPHDRPGPDLPPR
jgi:heme-degrading monooxygenase HmoA